MPDETGRPMTGQPITRVLSPDGLWAYTLYDGAAEGPFVHALDTANHTAVCVDLDAVGLPKHLRGFGLSMATDGGELTLLDPKGDPLATMDTGTFGVTKVTGSANKGEAIGEPWLVTLIASAFGAASGALWLAHRRRRQPLAPGGA